MKTIVSETALETKFWSTAIRTAAYFPRNGFTVPQPRPIIFMINMPIYTAFTCIIFSLLRGSSVCFYPLHLSRSFAKTRHLKLWIRVLCSILTGRKHDFTSCKLVNGLTGGIYHLWVGYSQRLSKLWPSPLMTTKMQNTRAFVIKTC